MKRPNKSSKGFVYDIAGVIALVIVAVALFFVDKRSCFIAIAITIVYGCVLLFIYKNG